MTTLPPSTPRWVIWVLNLVAFGIVVALVFFFKATGWQFALGFATGGLFIACCVRLKYGFWPDP